MSNQIQKAWLSPCVAVTFFAVSLTGLLMLFHLKFPGEYAIHQWGGLVFIIAGSFHLLLNWSCFTSYFRKSKAIWATVLGVAAMVVIALTVPHDNGYHGEGNSNTGYQQPAHGRH